MFKRLLLAGTLALLASFNAQARIGWTMEECIKQYGKNYTKTENILASWETVYCWQTGYAMITATFEKGKVVRMHYTNTESIENGDPDNGYFTVKQIKDLYAKNGGAPLKLQVFSEGVERPIEETLDHSDDSKTIINNVSVTEPAFEAEELAKIKAKS